MTHASQASQRPTGRVEPLGRVREAIRGWGSTPEERAAHLPCDDLRPGALVVDRAVDTDAPPAAVFRSDPRRRGARSRQRFMQIFRLVSFERDGHITLRWRWVAVTYRVTPGRLHLRGRWTRYGWLLAAVDLVMSRKQLLTLTELARRAPSAS